MKPAAGRLLLALGALGWACGAAPEKQASAQEIARGLALYQTYGCGSCHGPDGRGDGPAARSLAAAPRDFRNPAAFLKGYSRETIAGTIASGLGTMPAAPYIAAEDRLALADFIRSLASRKDI